MQFSRLTVRDSVSEISYCVKGTTKFELLNVECVAKGLIIVYEQITTACIGDYCIVRKLKHIIEE